MIYVHELKIKRLKSKLSLSAVLFPVVADPSTVEQCTYVQDRSCWQKFAGKLFSQLSQKE